MAVPIADNPPRDRHDVFQLEMSGRIAGFWPSNRNHDDHCAETERGVQCFMPAFEAVAATAPVASPRSKANHAGGVQPNIDMIPAIAITATDGDPANAVASMMATMNAPNPAAQIDSHAAVAPENATVTPSPMDAASGSGATTKSSAPAKARQRFSGAACLRPERPRRQTTVMTTRPAVLRKDTKPHQNVGTSSQRRHRSGGAQNDRCHTTENRSPIRPRSRRCEACRAQHESDSICIPGSGFGVFPAWA